MKIKIALALAGIGVLVFLAYLIFYPITGTVFVDYGVPLEFDAQVAQSDVIFVGKVTNVSPEMWNQDSGEYWAGGLPYRLIRFKTSQYVVDRIGLRGKSSIEALLLGTNTLNDVRNSKGLLSGATAVVFANKADIVWRENGSKPFIEIAPHSIFVQDTSGNFNMPNEDSVPLAEFITQIQAADQNQPLKFDSTVMPITPAP